MPQDPSIESRFFRDLTEHVPASLAIRESMRYSWLRGLLQARGGGRIWDVGCGDGSFWSCVPERSLYQIDGIELDPREAALARISGAFSTLCIGDITLAEPEPEAYDLVLGNCSLEHIPDIREALVRMRKGLKPDGQLILFVPAPRWTRNLALVRGIGRLGHRAEMAVGYAIDGFFQHHHLYGHPVWAGLLASLGYRNIRTCGLGGTRLNQFFARNLLAAAPEFAFKTVTNHYPGPILRRRKLPAICIEELRALPLTPNDPRVAEYAILADRDPA